MHPFFRKRVRHLQPQSDSRLTFYGSATGDELGRGTTERNRSTNSVEKIRAANTLRGVAEKGFIHLSTESGFKCVDG